MGSGKGQAKRANTTSPLQPINSFKVGKYETEIKRIEGTHNVYEFNTSSPYGFSLYGNTINRDIIPGKEMNSKIQITNAFLKIPDREDDLSLCGLDLVKASNLKITKSFFSYKHVLVLNQNAKSYVTWSFDNNAKDFVNHNLLYAPHGGNEDTDRELLLSITKRQMLHFHETILKLADPLTYGIGVKQSYSLTKDLNF